MQKPIESLEEVDVKKIEHIEDSQPDQETNAQNLEKQSKRSNPIKDFPKEEPTSFLNDNTTSK